VGWEIEFTDQFGEWWYTLSEEEQESARTSIVLLREKGPSLRFPHTSGIVTSRHKQMRELRVQHHGRPYRVLFAFDPLRVAILLIGGDKTGDDRWYDAYVPVADRLYDDHLNELKDEGRI
jgi:hypothetical protein